MAELKKELNLYGLTMIAVGACIGSGIFVTPAQIVEAVPHHGLVLLVWLLGGLVALSGALTFAELGGMFPQAGGVYVFLREAFGDAIGFLYGWVILLVITTGALAALAVTFAEYMTFFLPLSPMAKSGLAAVTILGLTVINIIGVDISQLFANLFTGLKLAAIAGVVVVGLIFYDPAQVELNFSLAQGVDTTVPLLTAILVALIGVLWSVGGWHHTSYLAGEAIEAERTVPRAMILGVAIVTLTYLLVNLAYMLLLPLETISGTERVAGDAVQSVFSFGGKVVAIAIAVSVFGSIGIYTMSAPRIYFAMARDGIFFKALSAVHPRWKTPVNAMLLQALWAVLLVFIWGSFSKLITYVVFMDILFMGLAGIAVFTLRRKLPHLKRPIRVLGYPVVPFIFVFVSFAFVLSTLIERPAQAIAGLVLLGLGLPVFYYFKNRE